MLYLYGDLTRARSQENTLELLRRVIDMAVEVLKLHQQIDNALLTMQDEKNKLADSVRDIEAFRADLQQTIHTSASERTSGEVVSDIGQAVTSTLQQRALEGKSRLTAQAEEKINRTQAEVDRLAKAAFAAMREFFMVSDLQASKRTLHCVLDGLSYRAESEVVDVAGICCAYSLNTSASGFFSGPKRFSDLMPGRLEIPVGTKKSWRKKDPVTETIRIDDAMLTGLMESEDLWEYRLATRAGSGVEGIQVRAEKSPQVGLHIFKIAEQGQVLPIPAPLFSQDQSTALSQFWSKLLPNVRQLYRSRDSLESVKVDGRDVTSERLFAKVIALLVGYLSPIIKEIDNHSLIQGELSLTIEGEEEGKREVIYIRKNKLHQQILELPESQRHLFAPLGLDVNLAQAVMPESPPPGRPAPERPKMRAKRKVEQGDQPSIIVKGVPVQDPSGSKDPSGSTKT